MQNLIGSWVVAHQGYLIGLGEGYALAHIPVVIKMILSIPWIQNLIKSNPQIADQVADEIQKDVHQIADDKKP